MSYPLRVKARRATANMVQSGMFAKVEIDVIDGQGNPIVRLYDGVLKANTKSDPPTWFLGQPQRPGGEDPNTGRKKYFSMWYLYPDLQRDQRGPLEQWILQQIFAQIPDPSVPEQPQAQAAPPAPAPAASSPPAPSAPVPAAPTPAPTPSAPPPVPAATPPAPPAPGGPQTPSGPPAVAGGDDFPMPPLPGN